MPGRAARPFPLAVAALAVMVIGYSRPTADRQASAGGQSGSDASGNTAPVVTIVQPDASRTWQWSAQFRYAITVTDKEDGDSAFGEIMPSEVLLDVEYLPGTPGDGLEPVRSAARADEPGLAILRKSACLNCHADKTSLVGPSFSAIADKYGDSEETIARLGRHIRNGSSGSWGSLPMPPHPNLSPQQTQDVARYIVEQGRRRHRWIYAGLEGVIRIIDRPDDDGVGFYRLTASYLDNGVAGGEGTSRRGEHSITLRLGDPATPPHDVAPPAE